MATNLLIGFPTANASVTDGNVTSSPAPSDLTKVANLFGGSKTDLFKIDTAQTGDCRLLWSGVTTGISYLILGNARLLQKSGVTNFSFRGKNSVDYATATVIASESSLSSVTLYGPESQDYITTFASTTYTYIWLNLNSPSISTVYPLANVYFGTLFDFGRDPIYPCEMTRPSLGAFQRRPLYSFRYTWQGVTKEKTYEAITWMADRRDFQPVFLYTGTYHYVMNNLRLLYARVVDFTYTPRTANTFDVTIQFEEAI